MKHYDEWKLSSRSAESLKRETLRRIEFIGGATITITPVFGEDKFSYLNIQVFNVTSVGLGNFENGESFIRPPARLRSTIHKY